MYRLAGWVEVLGIKQGERLWEVSPGQPRTAAVNAQEMPLGQKNVNTCTWKSVRSGRAPEMAASGFTLGQVLVEAGEWRSAAFLRYLDETRADNLQLPRTALDDSDDE